MITWMITDFFLFVTTFQHRLKILLTFEWKHDCGVQWWHKIIAVSSNNESRSYNNYDRPTDNPAPCFSPQSILTEMSWGLAEEISVFLHLWGMPCLVKLKVCVSVNSSLLDVLCVYLQPCNAERWNYQTGADGWTYSAITSWGVDLYHTTGISDESYIDVCMSWVTGHNKQSKAHFFPGWN